MHRQYWRRVLQLGMTAVLMMIVLGGCASETAGSESENSVSAVVQEDPDYLANGDSQEYSENGFMPALMTEVSLDYAACFHIYRYEGGYSLITMDDGSRYFLIPEGQDIPDHVVYSVSVTDIEDHESDDEQAEGAGTNPKDTVGSIQKEEVRLDLKADTSENSVVILQKPLSQIYMSASGAMALFDSAGALKNVRFSSLDAESWYLAPAREAIENGDILYAGKYSEPDYELLLEENCSLALENTMILHKPETKEKLEELGIPVMIERSSYETHPLGRTEWIKVYGELTDHYEQAEAFYETQKQIVETLEQTEPTGKTVAFFYISESGTIVTRKSSDYVAKMIGIAGGSYVFEHLGEEEDNASSTINMTMEDFYVAAKDADYLVYNATIDDPMLSIEELIAENELFLDFKAVQNDNVWCTGRNMYQSTDVIGEIIQSFHEMMTDEDAEDLVYMVRLH